MTLLTICIYLTSSWQYFLQRNGHSSALRDAHLLVEIFVNVSDYQALRVRERDRGQYYILDDHPTEHDVHLDSA